MIVIFLWFLGIYVACTEYLAKAMRPSDVRPDVTRIQRLERSQRERLQSLRSRMDHLKDQRRDLMRSRY